MPGKVCKGDICVDAGISVLPHTTFERGVFKKVIKSLK